MNFKQTSFLTRHTHLFVCASLLLIVSWGLLTPDPLAVVKRSPLSILTTVSDLILHFSVYTVFAGVCCSLAGLRWEFRRQRLVVSLLICHGLGTELLQTWIPCRTCDPLDALANLTGIAAGASAAVWYSQRRLKHATVPG